MNINCAICSDLFIPTAEVYITQCGHMFHFNCLIHWIERSQTCPQCRHKVTEKTIHRVYFNLANTEGITDDGGTLQHKLENIQFEMTLKEKEIKTYNDKYKRAKSQNVVLREEVRELEDKAKAHESTILCLKDKMTYFKSRSKESEKLTEEVVRLKNKIKGMDNVQNVINGTREQVNEILRNESNIESLALLSATLKKSLLDAERRKVEMEHNLKRAQNEAVRYRRECTDLECQNNDLRKELQQMKTNYENEKRYLKNKIINLDKKASSTDKSSITNSSLQRIIAESPVNFNRNPRLTTPEDDLDETISPSMPEKVKKIVESDSPYLSVKSSGGAIDYTSILNTKLATKSGSSKKGFSIFKPPTTTATNLEMSFKLPNNRAVAYNGLGGSSKEDIYPSPKKPVQMGLKRHKSSSSVTSSKFRKLTPLTCKVKSADFFGQKGSE